MFKSLSIRGVRCFRDRQVVDLGRFALAFGVNNSGKSALVRTLPWLKASARRGRPGPEMNSPALFGAGWGDLKWRGKQTVGVEPGPLAGDEGTDIEDIEIGLIDGAGRRWTWGIQERQTEREPAILRFATEQGGSALQLTRESGTPGPSETRRYLSEQGPCDASFDGLIPEGIDGLETGAATQLRKDLQAVQWVTALRHGPDRLGHTRNKAGTLDPNGDEIAALLGRDSVLLAAVSRWFEAEAGLRVEVEPLGSDLERLVVRSIREASFQIAFPDIGDGLQHVLPVVAHLAALRQTGGTLVIEEPEAHLHPGLQRAVAQEIVATLTAQPLAQVLVETHSEVFLLEALRASLTALAGDVRLLWVEVGADGAGQVETIGIDGGRPRTDQFTRAFEVMKALRVELAEARGRVDAH